MSLKYWNLLLMWKETKRSQHATTTITGNLKTKHRLKFNPSKYEKWIENKSNNYINLWCKEWRGKRKGLVDNFSNTVIMTSLKGKIFFFKKKKQPVFSLVMGLNFSLIFGLASIKWVQNSSANERSNGTRCCFWQRFHIKCHLLPQLNK